MRHSKDGILRIVFVTSRSTKRAREWYRGTMLYARQNQKWFVRVFEVDSLPFGQTQFDFGNQCPDGIISCGVPLRYIENVLRRQGYSGVPVVVGLHDAKSARIGTAVLDVDEIARRSVELFMKRGCCHIAYVGAYLPQDVRMSRALRRAVAAAAKSCGLEFSAAVRQPSPCMGAQITDQPYLSDWLRKLPKPCGILAWNDSIGRDVLDLCRADGIGVPGAICLLGIDDNGLICDSAIPTMSSISLDYENAAYELAKLLDCQIDGRTPDSLHLTCGVTGVTERASTQDVKGSARIVAAACEYIAGNACKLSTLDSKMVARHLGIGVRTLQMRFRESKYPRSVLQEIQRVRLERVCWLLVHSDKSITEIAFEAGFRSQSRLKSLFLQHFGQTMRDYRKSNRPN